VDVANRIFCPSAAELERARGVLLAMGEAHRDGRGAATYDGKMIDLASLRQAEGVVRKADEISARSH
jgi:malyl-CoA/(S)-citramalyl-CoA lyase